MISVMAVVIHFSWSIPRETTWYWVAEFLGRVTNGSPCGHWRIAGRSRSDGNQPDMIGLICSLIIINDFFLFVYLQIPCSLTNLYGYLLTDTMYGCIYVSRKVGQGPKKASQIGCRTAGCLPSSLYTGRSVPKKLKLECLTLMLIYGDFLWWFSWGWRIPFPTNQRITDFSTGSEWPFLRGPSNLEHQCGGIFQQAVEHRRDR